MKRVAALYRVSTKGQVDVVKDDIPMQKIACREFAERQGWTIVLEKEEKGVSGSKVSAAKRDAIQELKNLALKKEFDVLLVFMFDRLGRIDNETPFILEWFAAHGIEMWSVNEGQQKIENHTDKLMNYIRFWQASGESEKTSVRVKTRQQQMTSEGIYTGGPVLFGYMLVDKGRLNKKGKPAFDIAINPDEHEAHRKLFEMYLNEGYGTHQLATYLNERGFRTQNDCLFTASSILRILKSKINCGFLVRGEATSERLPELQVISDEEHERVLQLIKERDVKNCEKRTVALVNRGKELLSGNIYCAHCGCRLTGSRHIDKHVLADGTVKKKESGIYVCYHRSRKLNDCDGATTYYSDRVDKAVLEAMRYIFSNIAGCPEEEKIKEAYQKSVELNKLEQKKLSAQLDKDTKQVEALRLEIGKALIGESKYSSEDLSTAILTLRNRIDETRKRLSELSNEEEEKKKTSASILPAYKQFSTWASEFEEASFKAKKMIVSQLFSRIEVGKGYKIHLEMNLTYKQFCEDWMTLENRIGLSK